jgi:hypothetical protein
MTGADVASPVAQKERVATVRDRLRTSRLVTSGGVLRTRVLGPADLDELVGDALAARPYATEARVEARPSDARGDPDRWLDSAVGGPALQAFVESDRVLRVLARATGVTWRPAGPGSWSYYQRAGHHLGLHRDLAICDLAVITCVVDERADDCDGGILRVWPTRPRATLDEIRADQSGAYDVRLAPGETLLLLGGFLAHRLLPLSPGQVRVVAPACYQAGGCEPEVRTHVL